MENSFLYSYVIPLIACIGGFSIVFTFYYIITESLKNSNQNKNVNDEDKQLSNRKERGQKIPKKFIQETPGPLSCEALNYVERDCDKILESIDEDRSEAYTINGGFQTGKTSLIRRYIYKAKEKGWGVIDVNFEFFESAIIDIKNEKEYFEKILYLFIIETAIESLRGFPLESDEVNKLKKELDKSKSSTWALKEFSKIHSNLEKHYNHDYCVICFDGVDHIYDAVKRIFGKFDYQVKEEIDQLMFFFNKIRTKMTTDFNKVKGLLCTTGPWSEDAFIKSKCKSQSREKTTDFFNNEEILRLKAIFITKDKNYKNIDDEKLKELNEYFNGTPYLMHNIVIEMCKNNAQVEAIKQAAKKLSEPYEEYWNRIKRIIEIIKKGDQKSMYDFIGQHQDHEDKIKNLLTTYGIYTQDFSITPFIKDMLEKEKKATDAKQS